MQQPERKITAKKNISISANFTIELIEPIISFWIDKCKLDAGIKFAPYNQVFQELLDRNSLLAKNDNGINVLFIKIDDLVNIKNKIHELRSSDTFVLEKKLNKNIHELLDAIKAFSKKTVTPVLVVTCPPSPIYKKHDNIYNAFQNIVKQFERSIESITGVYCITYRSVLNEYPIEEYYEELGEQIGHIPYTQDFFISLGTMVSRKIYGLLTKPFKAIAVDCDNTIWTGIVGEDGVSGIKIDERRKWIQKFLIDQYKTGKIICLCSKNNEPDVDEVFNTNNDMLLKKEHISHSKINWLPKSQNLRAMARELNIGIDSFIFIDDSPVECEEVKTRTPEVLVVQLPEKFGQIKKRFNHLWAFDYLKITSEDKNRTKYYQSAQKREQLLKDIEDYSDFITNLNITIDIEKMQDVNIQRASQLTQRVNQFNLSTIRRTEAEVEQINVKDDYDCFVVHVRDKFGEYGLVGFVVGKIGKDIYDVDTFLLSCRALGRGVEYKMLSYAGERAYELGIKKLRLECKPTPKNKPIRDFIKKICENKKEDDNIVCELSSQFAMNINFKKYLEVQNDEKTDSSTKKVSSKEKEIKNYNLLLDISNNYNNINKIKTIIFPRKLKHSSENLRDRENHDIKYKIYDVWCEVLNKENIEFNDKFFEIGGKSIHIPLVVIYMQKKYDIKIRIVDLFEYPTISSLADFIEKSEEEQKLERIAVPSRRSSNALRTKQKKAMDIRKQLKSKT